MVALAFGQKICGFDLLRSEKGISFVCDVNGLSLVKNSSKYYDDASGILRSIILSALAPHRVDVLPAQAARRPAGGSDTGGSEVGSGSEAYRELSVPDLSMLAESGGKTARSACLAVRARKVSVKFRAATRRPRLLPLPLPPQRVLTHHRLILSASPSLLLLATALSLLIYTLPRHAASAAPWCRRGGGAAHRPAVAGRGAALRSGGHPPRRPHAEAESEG